MMTSEALYIAEKLEEKVAFVTPGTFEYNQKTLLAMSLENDFKDVGNIEVSCLKRTTANGIDYQNLLMLIQTRENCHYFIDELHLQTIDDINILKEISQMCENKTLWITISSKSNEVLYDTLKSEFADFYIPDDLVYPLRNTSTISKYAYSRYEFHTVILIAQDDQMHGLSTVKQRAIAKLIVCQVSTSRFSHPQKVERIKHSIENDESIVKMTDRSAWFKMIGLVITLIVMIFFEVVLFIIYEE